MTLLTLLSRRSGLPVLPLELRVVGTPGLTISFTWTPPAGVRGYLYYINGQPMSRTFDPTKAPPVRFAYVKGNKYEVVAVGFDPLAQGAYQA